MKKLLITLAMTVVLVGPAVAPAKVEALGIVDFSLLRPVGCRNLNDAVEASQFNTMKRSSDIAEKLAFVRPHQVNAVKVPLVTPGIYYRVPASDDCVIIVDVARENRHGDEYESAGAVAAEIKRNVPGMPPGMIAICAVNHGIRASSKNAPPDDCTGTGDPEKVSIGYWIVAAPEDFTRNFDLPKED